MRRVLTIAGSDSGGGAGIQADLKAMLANGVFGMSVVTALTAQNTLGVTGVHLVPADFVREQFEAVASDLGFDVVKTGMLANATIASEVVRLLRQYPPKALVVDPVMVSTSGSKLLDEEAIAILKRDLIPMATLLTPNIPEASALLNREIDSLDDMKSAAADLVKMGAKSVLVKGGHSASRDAAVDILFDGSEFHAFTKPWIDSTSTHGTGCTLASASAAWIARGQAVPNAVKIAKDYVFDAMLNATPIGKGHGPLNHGYKLTSSPS